ncbi:MAG: RNA polymerase sigma factor SigJ [Pseudonocardia sp.]
MLSDPGLAVFEEQRPRLFGIAYRMLGSAHDAEDAVQDAWLRWAGADRAAVESVPAFLTAVITRLCLNRLASARVRRETYPGPWLPEPVLTPDPALGPLDTAELRESVSLALLVTLEQLTPAERAVYVLREAFEYSHREVAVAVELSEGHCRQLHSRARRHLAAHTRPVPAPDRARWTELVERFLAAARGGDLTALEAMLAADVTAWSDGGGQVPAARRPVHGRAAVARYLAGVTAARYTDGLQLAVGEVNGEPAVLVWSGGGLGGVLTVEIDAAGAVRTTRFLVNPDKLVFLARRHAALSRSGPSPSGPSRPWLSRFEAFPGHP